MVKAIVFDMDGVLFDTENLTAASWHRTVKKLGCTDVTPYISEFLGLNAVYHKQAFLDKFGADFPYDEFIKSSREYSVDFIVKHGVPLKPGVFELLDYLKQKKFLIAVATSTRRETVLQHFKNAGITDYFDQIICGDMVEKSKPNPEIYLKAAAALGIAPQDCIALEDSPNGLTAAYRAGIKTVMVPDLIAPTAELRKMLFACVPSLNDVIPLLKQLERQEA